MEFLRRQGGSGVERDGNAIVGSATKAPRPLWIVFAVGCVVVAGWLLRAWPGFGEGGWRHGASGYDDAVYFTAAALFARGELPYRDFVLVHPPGMLLFLAPVSMLVSVVGAAGAFSAARWLATLVGAANIALSARVAHRAAGPVAAVVAAACYAVLPEIVYHERTTFLEPLLNLSCLLLANAWLARPGEAGARRPLVAGLCLGFGISVKAWALLWAPACLLWPSGADPAQVRSSRRWLIAGVAAAVLVVNLPFLLAAPGEFVSQTFWFQVTRPADGMLSRLARAYAMLERSWSIELLAIVGLIAAFRSRRESARWRSARFFGLACVLTVAAFLVSRTYWPHYNAHLAPAEAHLAGFGGAALWEMGAARRRGVRLVTVALLATLLAVPLQRSLRSARDRGDLLERVGERVRAIPAAACYFAFEPAWALAGDRLPSSRPGQPPVVDVYGSMLLAAHGLGREHALAGDALRSRAAQEWVREALDGCEFLSLGERGERQLTPHTRQWIARRWEELPAIDDTGVDLWRLRQ
jgi:hypothetical protein